MNGLASVKNLFILKLPPFFPSPTRQGKKGGNFKTIRSYIVLALGKMNKVIDPRPFNVTSVNYQ